MRWLEQNRSAVQLLVVALTLALATFTAIEDDLPKWFGYIPLSLSVLLVGWFVAILLRATLFGESRFIAIEDAAREIVPKLPTEVRQRLGTMLGWSGVLTAKLFAHMIGNLGAEKRPQIFGRADLGMKLEPIPDRDFEASLNIENGALKHVGDGKVLWLDLHLRRRDVPKVIRYFKTSEWANVPRPSGSGPRIRKVR